MGKKGVMFDVALLTTVAFAASPAWAQQAQPAAEAEGEGAQAGLEEIVVTATKREVSLQRVPITITAFSDQTIQTLGISTSDDIGRFTPNVSWRPGFGYSNPHIFLRGLGSDSYAAHGTPVGIYVDGVYLGANAGQSFQAFDLERAEVLKGPQGTLYGRNTTGGLINYITRKPSLTEDTTGYASAGIGNFGLLEAEGAIGLKLSDIAAIRISGNVKRRDGYLENGNSAVANKDVGEFETVSARAQLLLAPAPDFEILLKGYVGRTDAELQSGRPIGLCADLPDTPANEQALSRPGDCPLAGIDLTGQRDFHTVYMGLKPREDAKVSGGALTLSWDVGGAQLISLTAYDFVGTDLLEDTDEMPVEILSGSYARRAKVFNQEIRLVSDTNRPFSWIVGGNYYRDSYRAWNAYSATGLGPGGLVPAVPVLQGVASDLKQITESFAVFGEGMLKLTDRLTLTVGARWTKDKRDVEHQTFIFDADGLANRTIERGTGFSARLFDLLPRAELTGDWERITGRATLDYELSDDVMTYASYSRGFRGGEFNLGALFFPSEQVMTNPEYNDAFEVGVKTQLLDRRLRLNAATFYYNLQDLQVFILGSSPGVNFPTQTLANAGQARIIGLDTDLEWQVNDNLYLRSGLGILDTKISEPAALAGNRLSSAPKVTFNGVARYEIPLGPASAGRIFVQPEAIYTSSQFFNVENKPYMEQPAYWLFDARIGWESADSDLTITAWVRNIGGKHYTIHRADLSTFGFANSTLGHPRTFGLTARHNF